MTELDQQVSRGLRLTVVGQAVTQGIQFPTQLVLARLLMPQEFGVVGQVAVFTGLAYYVADLGLGTAIVQRKELDERELSTLFWINMAMGLLVFGTFAAFAPLIAHFYDNDALVTLTIAIATTFIFSSLKVTHYNLLRREMRFGHLALVDAAAQLGGSIAAITLAALGFGVWALVALRVVRAFVPVVVLFWMGHFRPRFVCEVGRVKDMLHFGGFLLGGTTARYASRNVDKAVVGRAFGDVSLGLYLRAFDFMVLPVQQISHVIGRVMVPALSRAQDDHPAMHGLLLSGLQKVAFFAAPLMGLVAVTSEPLIVTLFGKQWIAAAPILRVFSLLGLVQAFLVGVRWVHVAKGAGARLMRWDILDLIFLSGGAIVGAFFGMEQVAWGLCIAQLVLAAPMYAATLRLIELPATRFLGALAPTLFCSVLAITPLFWVGTHLTKLPHPIQLLVLCAIGLVLYLVAAAAFRLPMLSVVLARLRRGKRNNDS